MRWNIDHAYAVGSYRASGACLQSIALLLERGLKPRPTQTWATNRPNAGSFKRNTRGHKTMQP